MTLEQVRALPWYEHDSIMERLRALVEADGDEAPIPGSGPEASATDLTELGFSVRQVE